MLKNFNPNKVEEFNFLSLIPLPERDHDGLDERTLLKEISPLQRVKSDKNVTLYLDKKTGTITIKQSPTGVVVASTGFESEEPFGSDDLQFGEGDIEVKVFCDDSGITTVSTESISMNVVGDTITLKPSKTGSFFCGNMAPVSSTPLDKKVLQLYREADKKVERIFDGSVTDTNDCYCYVIRGFLSLSEIDLYHQTAIEHCTKTYTIMMGGRLVNQPRTNASFSDKDIVAHNYNSVGGFKTEDWPDSIRNLRDKISDTLGCYQNSVLLNGYKDGTQYIGEHSDKNLQDPYQTVVTVSTGASRRFVWKNRADTSVKVETELHEGDLVMFWGKTNSLWTHQIPKQLKVKDPRYSYTFRLL